MTGPFEEPIAEPSAEVLRDLHRRMVRIRLFEEAAGRLFEQARIPGFIHLYVGQAAVAAGVCSALGDGDQISSTHRGHGHLGAGFANQYRGMGDGSGVFCGDGATNVGAFHEAANMAAALKLPVVFICENNEYAEYTRRDRTMAIDEVAERAAAYGMPSIVVDGMDAVSVRNAALGALQWAREGNGPSFVECKTYRYYNHHGVQTLGMKYRPDEEVEEWKALDAIERLEARIVQEQAMTKGDIEAVRVSLEEEVQEAVTFGESSPDPDPAELLDHVYSEPRSAGQ